MSKIIKLRVSDDTEIVDGTVLRLRVDTPAPRVPRRPRRVGNTRKLNYSIAMLGLLRPEGFARAEWYAVLREHGLMVDGVDFQLHHMETAGLLRRTEGPDGVLYVLAPKSLPRLAKGG